MVPFWERAAHSVLFTLCLFVMLVTCIPDFGFEARTLVLIYKKDSWSLLTFYFDNVSINKFYSFLSLFLYM